MDRNELLKLAKQADKGDLSAYSELLKYNRVVSKRANTRLKALEKAGLDYYAYDRAVGFTQSEYDRNRFTTSKKLLSPDTLYQQILEVDRFLSAKSSTITGQKQIVSTRLKAFKDRGINIKNERDFFNFLASDVFKELAQYLDSDQVIAIADQLDEQGLLDSFVSAYNDYTSKGVTVDVVLSNYGVIL